MAAILAPTAPARAQSTSDIAPPVRYLVDENGIDVARGEHLLNVTDLSIGPAGQGGLAYVRQLRWRGGGNPYDVGLFQSGATWTASVGLRSYAFTQSGTSYTSSDGSGATLVQAGTARTLTLPDGTVIIYDYNVVASLDVSRKSRATSITYPNGDRVQLTWVSTTHCSTNLDGCSPDRTAVRLQAVSSPAGYQLHFNYGLGGPIRELGEYNVWKQLNSITAINTTVDECDPAAHSCTLTQTWPSVGYSGNTVTDPEGRISTYSRSSGPPGSFSITRPGSASPDIVYNYDAAGFIDSVIRDGLTWNYSYSVSGNEATLSVADPGNHTRTIISDLNVGLPTSVTNELNQTTTYTYYSNGRLRRATAPETNYVEYTYDARGNVTQVAAVAKGGTGSITTSAGYLPNCPDPQTCNQPTSTTDANGRTTGYSYYAHGGVDTVTAPAGPNGVQPQTRYTYTAFTLPGGGTTYRVTTISACQTTSTCNGLADETETVIAYAHPNLLPTSVTRRNGTATLSATDTIAYDGVGNRLTVDGPLSGPADTIRTRYNLAREVTGTISSDPDGTGTLEPRAQRITRHPSTGLVTRVEAGTVNSQSAADWATFAALERVDILYDTAERPVRQTLTGSDNVARAQTQISYDSEGRPWCTAVRMNPALFGTSTDACLPVDPQATANIDRITRTSYDAANRPTRVETGVGTTAAATEVATAYTPNGRVLRVTDGNNNRTTYEYDGYDRLARIRYPIGTLGALESSTTDDEWLTYDDNGNVLTRTLRDATVMTYTYDALNRLWTKNPPGTGEPTVTYNYDNLGRMTAASTTAQTLSFTYDALGRQLTETGPFGETEYRYDLAGRRTMLNYPGTGLYINYDYLVTGEVTRLRENGATTGIGVLATFGYDQLGRRTSLTRGNGTVTGYDYDPVSRLASLTQSLAGTAHDLTLGFTYNPASQIATNTRSNDLFSYTGHVDDSVADTHNGRNEVTATDGATVSYDGRHNISAIGTTTYSYNSENMLVSGGGITLAYDPLMRLYQASSTRWAYDGATMIAEYNSSGSLLRRFVHGPGVDEPIVWYEGAGLSVRRFFHADERGSIIAVSDSAGVVIGTNTYDEYGVPTSPTTGRFQYTGQVWISSLGLYYYRARFYHPRLGRFMQADPIGYGGGMNMYAYVGGDPVNASDPSGTTASDMWTGTRIPYSKGVGPGICLSCSGSSSAGTSGQGSSGGGGGGGIDLYKVADIDNDTKQLAGQPWVEVRGTGSLIGVFLTTAVGAPGQGCRWHPLVCSLWADLDVRERMINSWTEANRGPESAENEHGFWITRDGNNFIAGHEMVGRGPIMENVIRSRPIGADIYFHTHNFAYLNPSLSGLDSGLLSRNAFTMVIFSREGWAVWESPLLRRGR